MPTTIAEFYRAEAARCRDRAEKARLPSARLDGVMSPKTACESQRSWKPLTLKCIPQQHHHVGHQAFVPSSRAEPSRARGGKAHKQKRLAAYRVLVTK